MISKDKLVIPMLGVLPSACAPDGFESLEGFGELGDDGDAADDAHDDPDGSNDDVIEGPFELQSAEFEDLDTIVLSFSHPLASFAEVDPGAFRISLGLATSYFDPYYGTYYEGTRYWDPNYIGGYYYGTNQFRAIALEPGPGDDQLRIEFDSPMTDYACSMIANVESMPLDPPNSRAAGLFVHYRASVIPLRDTLGNDLPQTGPDWVVWPYDFMFVDGPWFSFLDPQIEIPCP